MECDCHAAVVVLNQEMIQVLRCWGVGGMITSLTIVSHFYERQLSSCITMHTSRLSMQTPSTSQITHILQVVEA